MAKKTVGVSLRKPPPPANADAFVGAAAHNDDDKTPTSGLHALARAAAHEPRDVVVASTSGKSFRELTLYVPQELAQKLGVHCAENDRDMSNVIAEAVAKILEPPPPVEAIIEPPPVEAMTTWRRPLARFEGAIKLLRDRIAHR